MAPAFLPDFMIRGRYYTGGKQDAPALFPHRQGTAMTSPSSKTEPQDGVDIRPGLTYATHDGVALLGDLYLPKGAGPFPTLVALHGGGWVQGVRGVFQYWGPHLAARGYALFAISYRLAKPGVKTFPHAVQDALAAVQFVRGSAAAFKLDPDRVGLLGASAGANIAALAALGRDAAIFKNGYPQDAHAAASTNVKVFVGVYGVYDVLEMWQRYSCTGPRDNNIEKYLGVAPTEDRRPYFDASPISYATVSNNQIAVFLACGTEDDLVNRAAQTDAFLLALKQAGFFVRPLTLAGAGHYWMNDPIDEPTSYTGFMAPRLLRFLAEKL
jgi:acetyl esterase/lipase